MVGRQGHSREDPIHAQQHIPVHLAPAKGLGHLTGSVQMQISLPPHHPPPPPSPPPSHTFLSDHLPPHLPASFPPPHLGHLGRGLGSHRAKSRRSLTRTDFPPLTSVERHDAQNTQDAIFSREHANGTHVYSAKLNLVINIMVVLWWMCVCMIIYVLCIYEPRIDCWKWGCRKTIVKTKRAISINMLWPFIVFTVKLYDITFFIG